MSVGGGWGGKEGGRVEEVGCGSPTGHPASVKIENLPELVGSVTVKFGALVLCCCSPLQCQWDQRNI